MPSPSRLAAARSAVRRLPKPIRRFLYRYLAHPPLWHLTLPGFDRWLELRWATRIRRAPVMSPQEHAAAVADPGRRGADIEVPLACAICGGTRLRALLHVHDQKRATPRWDYHVVRCAACGFLYRHPGIRPDRLGELYASGSYAKFLAGKYTRKRIRRYKVTMAPFGALFKAGDGRRLLDFGCGNGLFLDIAYKRGFECYGVDLAADAIEAARQKPSGRQTYHGAPAEIPEIAAGGFDVITMWSVLAHLAEPVDDLTMLRRLLAPDGVPHPHRQCRLPRVQAPARDMGRVHAEPPPLLLTADASAAPAARRVRLGRDAPVVRGDGRVRNITAQR